MDHALSTEWALGDPVWLADWVSPTLWRSSAPCALTGGSGSTTSALPAEPAPVAHKGLPGSVTSNARVRVTPRSVQEIIAQRGQEMAG